MQTYMEVRLQRKAREILGKESFLDLFNRQAMGGFGETSYIIMQFYFSLRACVLDGVRQYGHSCLLLKLVDL